MFKFVKFILKTVLRILMKWRQYIFGCEKPIYIGLDIVKPHLVFNNNYPANLTLMKPCVARVVPT